MSAQEGHHHHGHHHHGKHHHHGDHHKHHHHEEDESESRKREREQGKHQEAARESEGEARLKRTRTDTVSTLVAGSAWGELTSATTVADLVAQRRKQRGGDGSAHPPPPLVYLEGDFTVGAAMSLLARHHLLSAPVIDPRSHRFLGFVDVLDIAGYALPSTLPLCERQSRSLSLVPFTSCAFLHRYILASYSAHSDDSHFLKKELLNEQVSHILSTAAALTLRGREPLVLTVRISLCGCRLLAMRRPGDHRGDQEPQGSHPTLLRSAVQASPASCGSCCCPKE